MMSRCRRSRPLRPAGTPPDIVRHLNADISDLKGK